MSTIRQEQLEQYNEIYSALEDYKHQCPVTIIDFFIYHHKLNSIMSKKVYRDSMLNIVKNANENIISVKKDINTLTYIVKRHNVCDYLQTYIKNNQINETIKKIE
tara:strand:- start:1881 stop:2195 length:315 start_codon:yes stop_codon:yes gene_type:complete